MVAALSMLMGSGILLVYVSSRAMLVALALMNSASTSAMVNLMSGLGLMKWGRTIPFGSMPNWPYFS